MSLDPAQLAQWKALAKQAMAQQPPRELPAVMVAALIAEVERLTAELDSARGAAPAP